MLADSSKTCKDSGVPKCPGSLLKHSLWRHHEIAAISSHRTDVCSTLNGHSLPTDSLVLGLGITALFVGILLAYLTNASKDSIPKSLAELHSNALRLLVMFTWMVSTVSAGFVGKWVGGLYGMLLAPLVWSVFYFWLLQYIWNSFIAVMGGTLLIIRGMFGTQTFPGMQRIFPPLPLFEAILARMPLSELTSEIIIEHINTKEMHDIKRMNVLVRYNLREKEWFRVFSYPNRFTLFPEVMASMNGGAGSPMENPVFWQTLFDRLIQHEVTWLVREIIFCIDEMSDFVEDVERQRLIEKTTCTDDQRTESGRCRITTIEIYRHRELLAKHLQSKLKETFGGWGLELRHLEIHAVELPPERMRAYNFDREIKGAERKARIEAEKVEQRLRVLSEVKADSLQRSIEAIGVGIQSFRDQGIELSSQEIQEIVRTAMQEITVILRLGNDTQERIDPLADLPPVTASNQSNKN